MTADQKQIFLEMITKLTYTLKADKDLDFLDWDEFKIIKALDNFDNSSKGVVSDKAVGAFMFFQEMPNSDPRMKILRARLKQYQDQDEFKLHKMLPMFVVGSWQDSANNKFPEYVGRCAIAAIFIG